MIVFNIVKENGIHVPTGRTFLIVAEMTIVSLLRLTDGATDGAKDGGPEDDDCGISCVVVVMPSTTSPGTHW